MDNSGCTNAAIRTTISTTLGLYSAFLPTCDAVLRPYYTADFVLSPIPAVRATKTKRKKKRFPKHTRPCIYTRETPTPTHLHQHTFCTLVTLEIARYC